MGPDYELDFKSMLHRMLSGKITSTEKIDLQSYIQNSFHDDELNLMMRNHWISLEDQELAGDDMQLEILKNRIISKINQKADSSGTDIRLFRNNWKNYLMRAAAVLFIPLLFGSLFTFFRMSKRMEQMVTTSAVERVVAHPGSRVHFTLPDQTEVWLNSGSTLEYPLALNEQDNRKVKLLGQGYFKVAHDAAHPFFVVTDRISIKALGTCFDVSTYAEDEQISSTLEEGSIALMGLNGIEITRIHPGQKAIFDKKANTMAVKDVTTLLTTSWKDGKLIFRNTSLSDVTVQLERWFNCEIHLDTRLMNADDYTETIKLIKTR